MTLTDSSKDDRELEDCVATDQATADQKQNAMDLDAPITGLEDNANGITEEANFGASGVEGLDIERGDAEKKSSESNTAAPKVEVERKWDHTTEDYSQKPEVSSSRGGAANNITNPESPLNDSSPVSRLRRSDSSRPGLRKLNTTKTRSNSLTNSQRKFQDSATPESKGSRKRGEDGEELLRQTSSSEDLEGDGDEVDGAGYRCGICKEDFGSAKLLSLHKKHHPQYTLRRNPKRSRKLIDQEYTIEGGVAGTPVQAAAAAGPTTKKTSSMSEEFPKRCTECEKEFPSWKALFGHMRCHPEREWRGIQPPAEKSNNPQGSGPHASGGNLRRKKQQTPQLPPPPAPSVTEDNEKSVSLDSRRAGKASDNESDTESIEAAYMSSGDRSHAVIGWMKRSKRSRQTHRSLDAVNSAKSESNDMIEALMLLQSADKEKLTLVLTPESHHGRNSRSKSRTPESGLEAEADELPQRDRKVKMEAEVASPCGDTEDGGEDFDAGDQGTSTRSKYECATCKRQFKSHQALGGHRASHKKVKGCFARTNVNEGGAREQSQESTEAEDEEMNLKSEEQLLPNELPETSHTSVEEDTKPCNYLTTAKDDNEEMLNRKAKAHECTICHRVFTSGQALGGHKRCHWGGGSGTPEVTSASKPVQTGQQSRPLKEGVQLDLNLPAPECLEEEMAQQKDLEAAGMSNQYLPGPGLSFFNIMNNSSSRNSYGESPVEQGPDVCESEPISSTQVESSINQFSNFERAYHAGPLDSLTIHPKPHVTSMALVPGLTPTSA